MMDVDKEEPTPETTATIAAPDDDAEMKPVDKTSPDEKEGETDQPPEMEGATPTNEDSNDEKTSTTTGPDDDSTMSTTDVDDDDSPKPTEDPEILLIKAAACKEEGNKYFTEEKDYEKASRAYRKGVNAIKNLNTANTGDEQVKSLLLVLQTNLSMVQFKLSKYSQSKSIASKALDIDPHHVKALYRRAVAHRKLGDPDAALADLKLALSKEPNNTTVRKEFVALKRDMEIAKKNQKKSLQRAFSKGGLYDDKEEEKKKQEELSKQKKKEEEEAVKKRKQEWEDECVKRMAKGEDAISFEDWDKERLEKIEKERKEEETRLKEERRKARAAAKAASKDDSDDEDESESFTEKELAEMRGYKKTKDGRITSYFTREQSHQIDTAPKPIASSPTPQPVTPSSSMTGEATSSTTSGGKGKSSVWNHAGTWYVLV
jgi:tetratricopeptide (TPR) repeat protein